MAGPGQAVDKDGIPIPPKLRDHTIDPAQQDGEFVRTKPELSQRALVWKRRIIIVAMLLGGMALIGTLFRQSLREFYYESRLQLGYQAFREGNYSKACWHFDAILSDDPLADTDEWSKNQQYQLMACRLLRAMSRTKLDRLDAAMHDYDVIIDSQFVDFHTDALVNRAYLHYRLRHNKEALTDINRAYKLEPSNPQLLNSRAYLSALVNENLKQALTDIDKALKIKPEDAAYLDTRGYVLFKLKEYDAALTDLNQALVITEAQRRVLEIDLSVQHKKRVHRHLSPDEIQHKVDELKESLGVMYQHRGEVYQALEKQAEADRDFTTAQDLGYDPERHF